MRITTFALVAALIFPAVSFAGQINGTLRINGRPAPSGVQVNIICGGQHFSGETRSRGSYSVYVNQTGRCTFTVPDYGGASDDKIYSYSDPVRYDFDLSKSNSSYQLRRR